MKSAGCLFCNWFGGALLALAQATAAQVETAPADLVPLDAPSRLAYRQRAQRESAVAQKAFHDFHFTDRTAESGITFHSHCVDDVGKNTKPIHYDHGCGIAVADIDGDGLPDIYFVSQLGGNELWRNLGNGKFENITASAGVGLSDRICVGASFADVDNDGLPDLFVTTVRGGNVLFHNLGGGKFKDISHEAGVDYVGHSSGAVFFDFNNDGWLDLFVCNVGKYTTDERGAGGYYKGIDRGFFSHLDPKLGERSLLYRNLGHGKFQLMPVDALDHVAWSGDASFADVNGDGYPDLYVLNMQGNDHFYLNEGGKHFVDKTASFFPKTPWGAMGIKFFDFNNDGLLDLYLTDMHSDMTREHIKRQYSTQPGSEKVKSEPFCRVEWTPEYLRGSSNNIFGNALWKNLGNGRYQEVSDETGTETWWPWGPSVGDLNADGYPDIFVTAGMGYPFDYAENNVLLNEGGTKFIDSEFTLGVEPRLGWRTLTDYFVLDCAGADRDNPYCKGQTRERLIVEGTCSTRSAALVDIDGDGDLDIITNEINDRPQVLVSNLSEKKRIRYLKIKLRGTKSNRDGLGAVVKLTAGGLTQTQQNDGKSGYLSQSSLPLYFGLGEASGVERIEVSWPSGRKQVVKSGISPNMLVSLVEPDN